MSAELLELLGAGLQPTVDTDEACPISGMRATNSSMVDADGAGVPRVVSTSCRSAARRASDSAAEEVGIEVERRY
ncbi:hypothetical protein GS528_06670 [Rhodococcus hoagii]|nr:hypothetical protein [Prescottella equi]